MISTSHIPEQPLTGALPAQSGMQKMTDYLLVNLPTNNNTYSIKIEWLDHDHLVYAFPLTESTQEKEIKIISIHTGVHKILCRGETPKPSPDGQWIVFTRLIENQRQIWLMRSNGAEAKKIAYVPESFAIYKFNFNMAWSPDSKQIAFSYLFDSNKSAIDVVDMVNVKTHRIISINDFQIRSLSWSPDGNKLLFWKEKIEGQGGSQEDQELIQCIRLGDSNVTTLAQFDGLQQDLSPTFSPDSKQIAILYDPNHPYFDITQSIGLISTGSTNDGSLPKIKKLTHELKLFSPRWSHDGKNIYVLRSYGAYKQIYKINTATGKTKQITHSPYSIDFDSYELSPDGNNLAWTAMNAHGIRVLRVATSEGENERDLAIFPTVPSDFALSEVKEIEWNNDSHVRMRGLLVLPLDYQPDIQYPLIIDIHGGGLSATLLLKGSILASTPLEWQFWAANGYAVFVPEFRSSGALGELVNTHEIINQDIIDIETGIEELITAGIVDRKRLAVIGFSAGARRVNWLLTIRHQFKAIISKEGWACELATALNAPNKFPINRVSKIYGGRPQEVPQNYLKTSALNQAENARTPVLFLMGNPELGGIDFAGTVRQFYEAIKKNKVKAEFIYYPDEGHVFNKPANKLDTIRRSKKMD